MDPDRPVESSPAIWSAKDNPAVLEFAGSDLRQVASGNGLCIVEEKTSRVKRHIVLDDGDRRYRMTIVTAPFANCPGFTIRDDELAERRLAALGEFLTRNSLADDRKEGPSFIPTAYQERRLRLMLAILDRLAAPSGSLATTRTIAQTVIFPNHDLPRAIEWKTSPERKQAQRLIAAAKQMARHGYRKLLS